MRVIQVSSFFYPCVGGVERQVEEIAFHLQQKDINVKVFTTDATHSRAQRLNRYSEVYRGFRVERFRYQIAIGDFFRFSFGLVWQLVREDYDLIHLHNVHDGHLLPAIIIKWLRGKKLIVTGHNPYVVDVQKRGAKLQRLVKFYDQVLRRMSGGINLYVALLDSEKETVQQLYSIPSHRIQVIPNGIQDIFYEKQGDKESFYRHWDINPDKWSLIVGTASRLNFVKGLQNLELAADKLKNVLFIFAGGDDGYLPNLLRIFRDNKNVLFTKQYLSSSEVCDFYAAVDLFLLPSVYEPFGMTLVEAMAQGKLVLATSKGGPSTILGEAGEIIDPEDQKQWFERIKFYQENKAELESRQVKAIELAAQYRWEHVIEQLAKAYTLVSA